MRANRRKLIAYHGLPSNYERLEYIENISKSYIDCGLPPKYTFDYEIKAFVYSGDVVLGYKAYNDGNDYRFFYVNNNYYFDVGGSRLIMNKVMISSSSYYHAKFGNYYINSIYPSKDPPKVTGSTFNETMNGAVIKNLFLFGENTSMSVKGKVYFLKIKDSGKFIRYFIPVRRKSDGVIGMYDLVGRKFYTSPNGVAFTGG